MKYASERAQLYKRARRATKKRGSTENRSVYFRAQFSSKNKQRAVWLSSSLYRFRFHLISLFPHSQRKGRLENCCISFFLSTSSLVCRAQ